MPLIRPALASDVEPLNELYDHYIRETAVTFDLSPWSSAERARWLAEFSESGPYRVRVAEQGGRLLGYACSRRFREKAAYASSVETSVYVAPEATRTGLGSRLYGALFEALEGTQVHRAIAGITLPNAASVALHERFGFRLAGVMTEVGHKLGRYWDVAWYQKPLP